MAKGKPNLKWKERVLEQQQSGKSARTWSHENKIPYTTFCGWKTRLSKIKENETLMPRAESTFIELKDQIKADPGIILEYQEVKIYLKAEFDTFALTQCLNCLRGLSC